MRLDEVGSLVVLLDQESGGLVDGRIDQLFAFSPSAPIALLQDLDVSIESGLIRWDGYRVIIDSPEEGVYVRLHVVSEESASVNADEQDRRRWSPKGADAGLGVFVQVLDGVALSRHELDSSGWFRFGFDDPIFYSGAFSPVLDDIDASFRFFIDCRSGGPGSASCSQGGGSKSCSVTCRSGRYACCNPPLTELGNPSCRCILGGDDANSPLSQDGSKAKGEGSK